MINYVEKLQEPFSLNDIEWRVQRSGWSGDKPWAMVLAYVNARAVMDRLDNVFGPHGWSDEYKHEANGVMCSLSCNFNPDGTETEWITKQDGSPETQVEAFKGGISKALVRTAVKFGIGRYLYKLEANFANCTTEKKNGWNKVYDKQKNKTFYWQPPQLPQWALPNSNEIIKDPSPQNKTQQKKELTEEMKIDFLEKMKLVGKETSQKTEDWLDKEATHERISREIEDMNKTLGIK